MKSKYVLGVAMLLAFCSVSFGQSLERSVVSNAGQEFSKSNLSIEFTIGETVVGYQTNSSFSLSQGFNQAEKPSSGSVDKTELNGMSIYPNPTSDVLHLLAQQNTIVEFYDGTSRLMAKMVLKANKDEGISINHWESGIYYVRFINESNGHISIKKVIKL